MHRKQIHVQLIGLATLIALLPATSAQMRGVNDPTAVMWRGGTELLQAQTPAQAIAVIDNALAVGDEHVIMQFSQPLSRAEREQLQAAGVTLLDYLSNNAFFAAVSPQHYSAGALTSVGALRTVQPVDARQKLHPSIAAGEIAPWSVIDKSAQDAKTPLEPGDNPLVAAYVLFHRDIDTARDGVALVQMYGGTVRSVLKSVNGLVAHLPYDELAGLVEEDAVMWIEPPLPKMSGTNDSNRARVGADEAQTAPYGLDGSGIVVLIYDGGTADASHPDFGGRAFVRDTSGTHYHSTHVAGTVGGDGTSSGGTYRGMAPGVTLESYGFEQEGGLQEGFLYTDPGDIEADYGEAINTYGVDISNNSIGSNTAPNGFPCEWEGDYGVTASVIDGIVRGSLSGGDPFRIVWANGNERSSGRCGTTYLTTAPPACGKNHITVGALNSNDDSVTDFTSWGPTEDGRLKPDISAPGCQSDDDFGVTSCNSGGGYTSLCGTSMAAPTVCGMGALMLQDFRQQYPGDPDPRNSTLKAILAHTAVDIHNTGPDYQSGYGSVRVIPAIDLMRAGNFIEAEVDQSGLYSVLVYVNPGDDELKVTLAWDDPPGTPNVYPSLVNDLELRVFDPSSTRYYPWTLDPANPSAPAVRTQDDHLNNLEQVVIDNPAPGAYRVEIYGYNVPDGPQPFSLSATPLLINCSSQGTIALDRPKYACEGSALVRVIDCDLNTNDLIIETVTVTVASTTEPGGETLLLTETSAESATFDATLVLSETDAAGVLQISDGDTVTATYIDADDGAGGTNVTVEATSVVDCSPPVISNVVVTEINPRDATITFDTDEPANCTVFYGLDCAALTESASGAGFQTAHSIRLSSLTDNTTYFFSIEAEDQAANVSTDDNGGACYAFTTPEIPDFFTELFSSDNDLDNISLHFIPVGGYEFYAGCVEPITVLPTDPATGTPISLSDDSYDTITLTGSPVSLYGTTYSTFYVGSNGFITFSSGSTSTSESLENHFSQPRISGLYDDLNPASGGTVSWEEFADRVVVTWLNVLEYNTSNANTFQIEMYFDGQITISYLDITISDGLAGLSAGGGVPLDFFESDLSGMGSCGPRPPSASNAEVSTPFDTPISITLQAGDDGLPDPPATLTYVVTALPAHGTLSEPGVGTITYVPWTLTASVNVVDYTPAPAYGGTDNFTFVADDGGVAPDGGESNTATISITVGGPQVVYDFPMDSDPNWTAEGAWAFGTPTGGGSHNLDPTSGHTGDNVYGYNLAGDYTDGMPVYYLTTAALDCTDVTETELRFWRWLGVESSRYDQADLAVSNDGAAWTTLWLHDGEAISESAWSEYVYDISAIADGQATLFVRWGIGPTDGSVTYPGWNIDDVQIWGLAPYVPPTLGDVNCDGVINNGDIDPFVLAVTDPVAYQAAYPSCDINHADCNQDGDINNGDIDAFLDLLAGA